jgi:hypothetical protein
MRWVIAFGRFWYDFIVGDSMVLAIGGPAVLGGSYLFVGSVGGHLVQLALPLLVMVTLGSSLVRRSH